MDIKDNLVRLYIKRFVLPHALVFDRPGFIDFRISGKTSIFARQLLVPESFFVELEKSVIENYGSEGKRVLYSIGKKFGYSFSQLGRFENIKDTPPEKMKDQIMIVNKFIEGTYASQMNQDVDINKRTIVTYLKNFVICRKLGFDFFLATGGAAGVTAWMLQDKTIEGCYYDNQFNGNDHYCKVKCAPIEILKKDNFNDMFVETNLDDLNQDLKQYKEFNEETPITYTKSFNDYLDSRVFNYENGIITLVQSNERFFLMEVSCIYILELGLRQNSMDKNIFDIAFKAGITILGEITKNVQSTLELIAALGWGEALIFNKADNKIQVVINHFPWTNWYKEINFVIISGFISGIISKVYKREVRLGAPKTDMHNGYLTLILKEE